MNVSSGAAIAPLTPEDVLRTPLLASSFDPEQGRSHGPASATSISSQTTFDRTVARSESRASGYSDSAKRSGSRKLKPVTSRARMGLEARSPVIAGRPPLSVSMQQLGVGSQPPSPRWQMSSPRNAAATGSPSPMSVNRGNGAYSGMHSEMDETSSSISQKSEAPRKDRSNLERMSSCSAGRTLLTHPTRSHILSQPAIPPRLQAAREQAPTKQSNSHPGHPHGSPTDLTRTSETSGGTIMAGHPHSEPKSRMRGNVAATHTARSLLCSSCCTCYHERFHGIS